MSSVAEVEYREIPDHPRYVAGSDGTVWSDWKKQRTQIKFRFDKDGYAMAGLWINGKQRTRRRARLVLMAFSGPCPDGMEAAHNDGNPANDLPSNLEWKTHIANSCDRYRHGTIPRGISSGRAKLTEDDVRGIFDMATNGHKNNDIAKKYGVSAATVWSIKFGRIWSHVTKIEGFQRRSLVSLSAEN